MEKKEIKEFEIVEKLKKLWEENEPEIEKEDLDKASILVFSLPFPKIPKALPFFLERTSNKFLKEFDWKRFRERKYLEIDLGLFLSAFLRKNIENLSQKKKGIIEVRLRVEGLPVALAFLGYQNPKGLYLIIEGNCGGYTGKEMQGGKLIIKGDCEDGAGDGMRGGKLIIEGDCGDAIGEGMENGEIIVKGNCKNWTGGYMRRGKIIIEKDCGNWTGGYMRGGELIIKGKVESFHLSTFSPRNQGTITLGDIKIWENGNWTKKGKEMWRKGEILVK